MRCGIPAVFQKISADFLISTTLFWNIWKIYLWVGMKNLEIYIHQIIWNWKFRKILLYGEYVNFWKEICSEDPYNQKVRKMNSEYKLFWYSYRKDWDSMYWELVCEEYKSINCSGTGSISGSDLKNPNGNKQQGNHPKKDIYRTAENEEMCIWK